MIPTSGFSPRILFKHLKDFRNSSILGVRAPIRQGFCFFPQHRKIEKRNNFSRLLLLQKRDETMNGPPDWKARALALLQDTLAPPASEINELDWKSSLSEKSSRIAQHLSAIANYSGGGFLVFGIANTGVVEGVDEKTVSEILTKLSSIARDSLEPPVRLDHSVTDLGGRAILIAYIFESVEKPVHIRGKSIEDSWIRSAATTRKASIADVTNLLLHSRKIGWEERDATQPMSAREVLHLIDYRSLFELSSNPAPTSDDETVRYLESNGLIRNAGAAGYCITRLGALTAAARLDDFEQIARKAVRIIRYKGRNKVDTVHEQIGRFGYVIAFERMYQYLVSDLPTSEVIKDALREEICVYPPIALRELVANALVHQDFSITGTGPMIEIFDDRIELRSPGRLLNSKSVDRLVGTNPESRNERFAQIFRLFNICEERGTGFIKTIRAIEIWGLPPLHFEEGANYFKVTLYAPRKFSEMSPAERVQACYQHAQIQYLSSSTLTNKSLRKRLKVAETQRPQISALIKDTMDQGLIKAKDPENRSTKFSEYVPYYA